MRSSLAFLVCVVASWLAATCVEAQECNIFVEAYGGANSEVSRCVIETENGDFVVTGYYSAGTHRDVFLARFDEHGTCLWHKVYGGGSEDDEGYSVVETSSGDLVLVGYTRSHGDGADFLISKFNSSGGHIWSRYWGNDQDEDEELRCVIEAEDGDLWATGYTESFSVQSRPKVLVARISPTGTTLNCARAGKIADNWGLVGVSVAEVFGTYPGFCVTGSFTDPGLFGCGTQILLAKFDHVPDYLWAYRIGEGGDRQEGTAIVRTDDACLALAGNTEYEDSFYHVWVDGGFVLKTDPNAQLDWALREHGYTFYQDLRVWDLWQTQDDGLVATGIWHDAIWGGVDDGVFLTKWNFGGTELLNGSFEGGYNGVAHSGTETHDSCLMLAGATAGHGSGGNDLLLAMCRSDGTTCLPDSAGPSFSLWSPAQNSVVLVDASWIASTSSWYHPFLHVWMDMTIICSSPPDTEPPTVTVLDPNGGEKAVGGSSTPYQIQWTSGDNVGVTTTHILFSTDGGSTYPDTVASGALSSPWDWYVPDIDETACRIKVVCLDAALNEGSDESDADFEIISVTAVEESRDVPAELVLRQNRPNPFNPVTEIEFGLPAEKQISLEIFDVQGGLVETLAEGVYQAGYHTVVWRGTDTEGTEVSTGVYFYRLMADDKVFTRKMLMLK